ncbi:endolytic transglycosylase MltG [Demequina sp.]|uniref:endolytic transglycosylase MltG n=1 Tax=Demequina sp. TaxID=2050685 RepID=UPI003D1213D4
MTDLFEAETATTTTLDLRRLQRNKRRATRRKWTLVATVAGVVIFALGASVAYNFVGTFERSKTEIADYTGTGQGTIQVVVNSGDTGADIATTLMDSGVIASRQAFLQEWNANPDSQSIVPGYYFMHREMKAEYALQSLLDPDNRDLKTVSVAEGSTLEKFYERIAAGTGASIEDVRAAAKDTEALGLPAEAKGNLEGWLFPAKYDFNPGVTPTEVLTTMVAKTVTILDKYDVPAKKREAVLTEASLVEREAKLDEDRPLIASVINNRIEDGMPLGFDSTLKYILPDAGAVLTKSELATDSPYNTHLNTGLPPGPIASPGEESIAAVVNPAETDYLFFVTVNLDTGKTKYAKTYQQHLKYQKQLNKWLDEHPSK